MKAARNFFPGNLKFLRERKRMSQEALASELQLSRVKLNALENGHTKAPRPEDYIRISGFFGISIDSLLKVDLAGIGELKLRELEAGNDVYLTGGQLRVLAITVDKDNKENVEYVPVKAKAGYRAGHRDPEYIAGLPKFSFPHLPGQGSFRVFPTTGDSMLPIPEDSLVLAQYVEDWTALKDGTLCILILREEQDFLFKAVYRQREDGRRLLLRSLNSLYPDQECELAGILEIWKFHSYISSRVPEGDGSLQYVAKTVGEIRDILRR